jgi:hypothetical protein
MVARLGLTSASVSFTSLGSLLGEIRMVEGTVYSATTRPLAVVGYNAQLLRR